MRFFDPSRPPSAPTTPRTSHPNFPIIKNKIKIPEKTAGYPGRSARHGIGGTRMRGLGHVTVERDILPIPLVYDKRLA